MRFYFFSVRVVQLKGQCFLTSAIANWMCTCSAHKVIVLVLALEAWLLVLVLEVSVLVFVLKAWVLVLALVL